MTPDDVLALRLATQRVTGPAASDPHQVVRELLAVQAQDAPLARVAIAQRAGGTDADVRALIDAGRIVRTHVLRPTWHYVAADDIGWLLELTAPRLRSGLNARHRQLQLTASVVEAAFSTLRARLTGGALPRPALQAALLDDGVVTQTPLTGQQVGHLLYLAEIEGLILSGPLERTTHTYRLWDEGFPGRDRAGAVAELVHRLVSSHGPISVRDVCRWVNLRRTEVAAAVRDDPRLAGVDVDGAELWYDAGAALPAERDEPAHCLSTFDEAFLSYHDVGFPRAAGHPAGDRPYRFAEAGGGPVVCDRRDLGGWKRTARNATITVILNVPTGLTRGVEEAVRRASQRLAAAIDPEAGLVVRAG